MSAATSLSSSAHPWPPALSGTPAVAVIEQAIARGRLAHSLLLHGESLGTLVEVAHAIADRLLNEAGTGFAPAGHPDCFTLRPSGKMRQISAEATRELITKVQVTGSVGRHKVAIIHEADRMNLSAANIFLKTLEEPPGHTTLLLLTTHPYALLPTIRSRCLHFRFPVDLSVEKAAEEADWLAWLDDYRSWLGRVVEPIADKRAVADHIFSVYGLVARFGAILEKAVGEAWTRQKESLPADLGEDEQIAIETGLANGLRARLFADIEESTLAFARPRLAAGDPLSRRAVTAAIERLEHGAGLFRLNFNESAALEDFLLASLRLWSKRPG